MDPATHVRELLERGYTVFEGLYDSQWVDTARRQILENYDELGRPPLWSRESMQLDEDVIVCMAGLTVHGLLPRYPELGDALFRPELIEVFREVLGEEMFIEVAGWVISDKNRPFFNWHLHAEGKDDSYHLRRGFWPKIEEPQRLMALLYLDDLDPEQGPLLIYPHKIGEPLDPPYSTDLQDWEGQIELGIRAGTLVVIEACTWHAVRRQLRDGPRIWICCTFTAGGAERCGWFDERLVGYRTENAVLRSVLPR